MKIGVDSARDQQKLAIDLQQKYMQIENKAQVYIKKMLNYVKRVNRYYKRRDDMEDDRLRKLKKLQCIRLHYINGLQNTHTQNRKKQVLYYIVCPIFSDAFLLSFLNVSWLPSSAYAKSNCISICHVCLVMALYLFRFYSPSEKSFTLNLLC